MLLQLKKCTVTIKELAAAIKMRHRYYPNKALKSTSHYCVDTPHKCTGWSYREWDANGRLLREYWHKNGHLHRADGPAVREWHADTLIKEAWYLHGAKHRIDGPALYAVSGYVCQQWYLYDRLHREDGPAVVFWDGDIIAREVWYRNGAIHRNDGPAVTYLENGVVTHEWYVDGRPAR